MSFVNRYDIPGIAAGGMFSLWAYGTELQLQDDAPAVTAGLEVEVLTKGRGIASGLKAGTGYRFKAGQDFEQINIYNKGAAATTPFTVLVLKGAFAGSR